MEATVRMWGIARCCPLVNLEAWSDATSLAAMVAYTLRLSTVLLKGGRVKQGEVAGAAPASSRG
jgi:hypothetical protein